MVHGSDLGLIYSSMATFQIYVARRWMNMFGNKIKSLATTYNIHNSSFLVVLKQKMV